MSGFPVTAEEAHKEITPRKTALLAGRLSEGQGRSPRGARVISGLLGVAVVLLVPWVVVKPVFGIVGAAFHLLLIAAVLVGLYALARAGAVRRP